MTKKFSFLLLFIILAIAIFFRFYKLAEIPPGLYPDVAINGNDADHALETGDYKWFYPENNGREGLFMNLIALSFAIFGVSVWALKFVPAIIGTLTVLGMYLMVREVIARSDSDEAISAKEILATGSPRSPSQTGLARDDIAVIALLSSFFLAVSFWHVLFSRLGFRAIMVPFFLVWSFYFLFKGMNMTRITRSEHPNDSNSPNKLQKSNRFILYTLYFILSGILFGLGFHTYIAFRVAPLILGMVLLIEFYNYWPRFKLHITKRISLIDSFKKIYIKDGWWKWDIFFLAIIAAVLPLVIYFYNNPQDFMGRSTQVSVFASENPVKQLAITTVKTLGMFNIWGDCNWRHNYACRPELFWSVGILFLIGFALSIKEFLRPIVRKLDFRIYGSPTSEYKNIDWSYCQISLFLLTWFFAMLLPAILTNEGLPHALRAIGAIPPVFIFAGMGGWWVIQKFKIQNLKFKITTQNSKVFRFTFYSIIILFLIWLPVYAYDYYFMQWGKNPEVRGAYTQYFVDIGNYLNSLPENTKKYVIVNEGGVPVPYPDGLPVPAQTIMFIEKTSSKTPKATYLKPEQIDSVQISKSYTQTVVVPMRYDNDLLNILEQNFPQGQIKQKDNIWMFQIKN